MKQRKIKALTRTLDELRDEIAAGHDYNGDMTREALRIKAEIKKLEA